MAYLLKLPMSGWAFSIEKDETLYRKNAAVITPRCFNGAEDCRALVSVDYCFAAIPNPRFGLKQHRDLSKTRRPPHIM